MSPKPIITVSRTSDAFSNSRWLRALVPLIDWLTGFRKLDALYRAHKFEKLEAAAFAERLMALLGVKLDNSDNLLDAVPAQGPCLLVANHPLGAIEGVALARLLSRLRVDVKILANRRLQVFSELTPWFIFTDPLKRGAPGNLSSLRACHQHLAQGGLLVVFPAGRVATQRAQSDELVDYPWHRSVKSLFNIPELKILPVFVDGRNSAFFYRLGKLHPQLRMMTLMREMLKASGKTLGFYPARPVINWPAAEPGRRLAGDSQIAALRLLTFMQNPAARCDQVAPQPRRLSPIAPAIGRNRLVNEVDALPPHQCLVSAGTIAVYYSSGQQTPGVVAEIQRLRECVFRDLDEGSGHPSDGDAFDDTYVHIFLFDRDTQQVIGACRLGRTDVLQQAGGLDALYLNQMFLFKPGFVNSHRPCLEMGRSFIVPAYQRSFQALQLLFKGIGGFIGQFPQYQTLYGTVSISRQYSPLSTLLIREAMLKPGAHVAARKELALPVPAEMTDYLRDHPPTLSQLDWLVRQLETDGKGLPVLLRHYAKMGAVFHAMGIDPNFAGTPGLLLSVDVTGLNRTVGRRFLQDNKQCIQA